MLRAAQVPKQPGRVPTVEDRGVRFSHGEDRGYSQITADSGAELLTTSQWLRTQKDGRPNVGVSHGFHEDQAEAVR